MIDLLMKLYPRAWRERYEDEFRALLEDTESRPAGRRCLPGDCRAAAGSPPHAQGAPMIRVAKAAGMFLGVIMAAYFVLRALVEIVTLNPGQPESYHDSWGGPSYLGVLAVHCLPGVVGGAYLAWFARRIIARRATTGGFESDSAPGAPT